MTQKDNRSITVKVYNRHCTVKAWYSMRVVSTWKPPTAFSVQARMHLLLRGTGPDLSTYFSSGIESGSTAIQITGTLVFINITKQYK